MMEIGQLPAQPLENQYIQGILENDFQVLEKIYAEHLPSIAAMVKRNSGTMDNARDAFQEAIVVIFKKATAPEGFELTTSFAVYLSVCVVISGCGN